MYDQAVLIGRFQPFHNEHLRLLARTLEESHHVTILLGSHNASRNFRNPWTCVEREAMICEALTEAQKERVNFGYIRDYLYNDANWIAQVQAKTHKGQQGFPKICGKQANICLAGSKKDGTSLYLDFFPAWRKVGGMIIHPLNATDIRESFFAGKPDWAKDVPIEVAEYLHWWKETHPHHFESLAEEQAFIQKYKDDWKTAPYPPIFVTVDAVVICGGHVLVIKRGRNPGKGLWALPGGFVDQGETIKDAVLRELKEETSVALPRQTLEACMRQAKVFDHPLRSLRGRTITHAQLFVIDEYSLPHIQAGDDAAAAQWMSLSDIQENEPMFYEDHFHIINHFISRL